MEKNKFLNRKEYKTKLLLINTNDPAIDFFQHNESMYPYSLLFLLSYLHRNNYKNARILDLSVVHNAEKQLKEYLKKNEFDVVGFTTSTENRFQTWDLIKTTKKTLPKAKIIVGGNHFTYTAEETLQNIPEIEIVVRGEGEITLLELIDSFEAKKKFNNIKGISYRKNKKIINNPDQLLEYDIDRLNIDDEVIKYADILGGKYTPFMDMRNFEFDNIKTKHVHIGRGCPGRCVFCLFHKKKYRMRTVDSVINEIKYKSN